MIDMGEFELIDVYFNALPNPRHDVILGIGDDAACLEVPPGMQLLVSTDTLVAGVHFLAHWDPFDIAYKAVMVNVSDIAAMAGDPCWLSLSLTLPEASESFLARFSQGIRAVIEPFGMTLIGGDTTRGPLSITITIHGLIPSTQALRRATAKVGDRIYVTGELGAAALAVHYLDHQNLPTDDKAVLMDKLIHPRARIDFVKALRQYATAGIDLSDGLSSDLSHICEASGVGACLWLEKIPVHPLVQNYKGDQAIDFALNGGDDYELCVTVPLRHEDAWLAQLASADLKAYPIGVIEAQPGLRGILNSGIRRDLPKGGYRHF